MNREDIQKLTRQLATSLTVERIEEMTVEGNVAYVSATVASDGIRLTVQGELTIFKVLPREYWHLPNTYSALGSYTIELNSSVPVAEAVVVHDVQLDVGDDSLVTLGRTVLLHPDVDLDEIVDAVLEADANRIAAL